MPMYKTDGVRSFLSWDYESVEQSYAYDIEGNALIDNTAYSLENVVTYYRQPMLDLMDEISALSSDWQNIIFITDMHGTADKQHSQAIAIYMLENVQNINCIILGGDYSVSPFTESEYNTYMNPFLMRKAAYKTHVMYGNHEWMGGNPKSAKTLIANDFVYPKNAITGNYANDYYYWDDQTHKTRYMIINTSALSNLSMDSAQISWIANNVILPASDWHLIVFGHCNIDDLNGITTGNSANSTEIINAINNCNGHIVGYFCGHQHIDDTRDIGSFQQTTLLCDKFENVNWYDGLSVTNRVVDTVSEQAITIISINTNTRQVVCRRLGAGWENIVNGLHYTY